MKTNKQTIKVKNFQENFWKRRIAVAISTFNQDDLTYKVELYSLNGELIGSRVIPYCQLNNELVALGFKIK